MHKTKDGRTTTDLIKMTNNIISLHFPKESEDQFLY